MAPSAASSMTPGFSTFQRHLSTESVDSSTAYLVSLLKRRQIRGSKRCAVASTLLLLRTVELSKQSDSARLIERVVAVGRKLIDAAPHEPAVGNIVRRVLGIIREEDEDDAPGSRMRDDASMATSDAVSEAGTPLDAAHARTLSPRGAPGSEANSSPLRGSVRPPLTTSHTGATGVGRPVTSMFSINSHPTMKSSWLDSPHRSGTATPQTGAPGTGSNMRAEVIKGVKEIIDEINAADDEIAAAALDQIHPQEVIFTYSSSLTVQRFLLKAASKRKFTVIHAEAYPNHHQVTHASVTGSQAAVEDEDTLPNDSHTRPLTSAGIQVVMIPESAIFAVISRATKVVLDAHAVLTNGTLLAAAGTKAVIKAARFYRVPVIVLAATYKLSPAYPYDPHSMIEYGATDQVVPFQDAEMRTGLDTPVRNPVHDVVESKDIDLFVTNQVPAVVSSGFLYRVVKEQYRDEDLQL